MNHIKFITAGLKTMTALLEDGKVDFEDLNEYVEWCQHVVAYLYTGYLEAKGIDEKIPEKEEILLAQVFTDIIFRGLMELIHTEVIEVTDQEMEDALDKILTKINEEFDEEMLNE